MREGDRPVPPEPFRFGIPIEVRFRDLDALGHVNNAVFFSYMEQARVRYYAALGLRSLQFSPDQPGTVLAETRCVYRKPLYLGDTVWVWVRVTYVGGRSFRMAYLLTREGEVVAEGDSVQVCYDPRAQRSVPVPSEWKEKILAFEPGPVEVKG